MMHKRAIHAMRGDKERSEKSSVASKRRADEAAMRK